ncbi:helix-turn-helix domain-containing protein [Actinomadura flavalba]|uniref:helix-turn-helix domain-containing protein n=1 Tax=Actinomadura flavalba TaxID=1120938 RepID=UPI00037D665F|nr:helix-turn-helix transcriptional regulator [Actinomadura flavalba]
MSVSTTFEPRSSLRAQFAYTLQIVRKLKGEKQDDVARALYVSRETVSAWETARVLPDEETCAKIDAHYGTDQLFQVQWDHAQRTHVHEWFETYLEHEQDADDIRTFEPLVMPGLLQTEAYMRSLESSQPLTEGMIQQRLARWTMLERTNAADLWAVVDEAAIRRPVGGAAVMREQLAHVLTTAESDNVTIQVVPEQHGSHLGMNGALLLLRRHDGRRIGYVEAQLGGRLVEDDAEARRLERRFNRTVAKALSEHDSLALINRTMEEME